MVAPPGLSTVYEGDRTVTQYSIFTTPIDNGLIDDYGAIIGPYGITLYCRLAVFASADGECQVGLQALANATGMSKQQVRREVYRLIELGLIAVVNQVDPTTKEHHPNRYIILPMPPLSEQDAAQVRRPIRRDLVLAKNDGRCVYCGAPADTIDHVIPRSKGGTDDPDNLVPACRDCNSRKSNHLDWSPE